MSETNSAPAETKPPAAPTPAAATAPPATATTTAAPPPAAAADEPKVPKVKVRKPRQRACDEKDDKGKFCFGHLKRYYDYPKEIEGLVGGPKMEIYRCEFCKTLYKPNLAEMSHSFTLRT
jgi:hypothetical protein